MTEKQKKFIMEYAKCANATESALKAGYSKKTAYSIGQRLLKNVEIKQELKKLTNEYKKSSIADIQEMQEKLTDIIRQNASEEIVLAVSQGRYAEVVHDTKKAGLHDVVNAISLLGKMQGAFTDNLKLDISPVVIKDDLDE